MAENGPSVTYAEKNRGNQADCSCYVDGDETVGMKGLVQEQLRIAKIRGTDLHFS